MHVPTPHQDINDVLDEMTNFVATISNSPGVVATAKLAACNQESGDARGVIYYYEGALPAKPVYGKDWRATVFKTDNDYDGQLYQPALAFLQGLPLQTAVTANVSMSNAFQDAATLTVWWPADSGAPAEDG
jgi:hypothetical protein